jgi:hypothetical protein
MRVVVLAAEGLPPEHGLDPIGLWLIGECGETRDLPRLLRQDVAGEVVLRIMAGAGSRAGGA